MGGRNKREMTSDSFRPIRAEITTPEGVRVVLYEDTWRLHILDRHDEMEPYLGAVLAAVGIPDRREPDPQHHREQFYKRRQGPSRWLVAVVSFEQEPARIVTAFGRRQSPSEWTT
jgi:hypothetical protein